MTTPQPPGGTAPLGDTTVARIGYGAMQLSRIGDRDAAIRLLRRAVEAGVDHIDTAHFYGAANELIRDVLHSYDDLTIVTKVGADGDHERGVEGLLVAQQPEQLRASVETNLTALDVERVDVVNLRRLDAPPGLVAEGDQVVDLDTQLAVLVELRDEGKIGGIGLSNVSADQLRQAVPAGIVCVQNMYSMVSRANEPVLDVCREHDIAWVPFFPLGSAFPGAPKATEHEAVIEAARRFDATPAQVVLAWLLATYDRTLLIPGTTSEQHLLENLAAGEVHLDDATVKELDVLTR